MLPTTLIVIMGLFLFVCLSLILGLGLASREAERAAEAEALAGDDLGSSGRSADDLVARLEAFIRKEAAAVAAFVSAPSVGGLFGDASPESSASTQPGAGGSEPHPS